MSVQELRQKFQDKYSGSILDDTYDERDVKWVKTDDGFLRSVLACSRVKGDVGKATDLLNSILLFRTQWKANDLTEADINAELKSRNALYYKGTDKDGHKILHVKVHKSKKGQLVEESKKYFVWMFNQHYRDHPEEHLVLMFDFVDAGISNMDLDVTKFIVQCTSQNFPNILAYSLMFKMGTALETVWKIIKGWLDPEQSKKTFFVKRTNIQEYIPLDQLEPHMVKEDKK